MLYDINEDAFIIEKTFFFFWPCGILVPWQGIEPVPPAMEAQSFKHWTAKEVHIKEKILHYLCDKEF